MWPFRCVFVCAHLSRAAVYALATTSDEQNKFRPKTETFGRADNTCVRHTWLAEFSSATELRSLLAGRARPMPIRRRTYQLPPPPPPQVSNATGERVAPMGPIWPLIATAAAAAAVSHGACVWPAGGSLCARRPPAAIGKTNAPLRATHVSYTMRHRSSGSGRGGGGSSWPADISCCELRAHRLIAAADRLWATIAVAAGCSRSDVRPSNR